MNSWIRQFFPQKANLNLFKNLSNHQEASIMKTRLEAPKSTFLNAFQQSLLNDLGDVLRCSRYNSNQTSMSLFVVLVVPGDRLVLVLIVLIVLVALVAHVAICCSSVAVVAANVLGEANLKPPETFFLPIRPNT